MVSMLMSLSHSAMDPMLIAIVIGIFLSNLLNVSEGVMRGGQACLRLTLPAGFALYGMQLDLPAVQSGHWQLVLLVSAVMFLVTYFFSRYVAGFDFGLSLLIATGLSVCGVIAIVVIAAIVGARREDTSTSILAVMIAGFVGMIIYRLLPGTYIVPVDGISLLVGSTLPMLGQVKVAAMAFGGGVFNAAVNYKFLRISILVILALVVILVSRRKGLAYSRPWFLVLFVLLAVLSNVSAVVASMRDMAGHISGVLLTAAMASIGLSVDIDVMHEKAIAAPISAGVTWGLVSLSTALFFILIL